MVLDEKRAEVDKIDEVLVEYFVKRMKAVKDIDEYKKKANLPVKDAEIENSKLKRLLENVDDEFKQWTLSFLLN